MQADGQLTTESTRAEDRQLAELDRAEFCHDETQNSPVDEKADDAAPESLGKEQFDSSKIIKSLLEFFNPSGKCRVAEAWISKHKLDAKGNPLKGFAPMCANKWKPGCTLKGNHGACNACPQKAPVFVTKDIIQKHLAGDGRYGIYPLLPGGMVQLIAVDLDGHHEGQSPDTDARTFISAAAEMQIPAAVFSSNSGAGYHCYLFFLDPVEYHKARKLMQSILERCNAMTSFDKIIPVSDTSDGGLIALPLSGEAFLKRGSTLPVGADLKPGADTLEGSVDFLDQELEFITSGYLEDLLEESQIHPDPAANTTMDTQTSDQGAENSIGRSHDINRLHIKADIKQLILNGEKVGFRSNAEIRVIDALVHDGRTDIEIIEFFLRYPIGQRFRDEKQADNKWLIKQIDKARAFVKSRNDTSKTIEEVAPALDSKYILDCLHRNEVGDAEIHKRLFNNKFIYDHAAQVWYRWGTHYWEQDRCESIVTSMKTVCMEYEKELSIASATANAARQAGTKDDRAEGIEKALRNRLVQLQSKTRISNVLALSRAGVDGLGTAGDKWDANPLLLGFQNGVLNMETGEFRAGQPADMILTPVGCDWVSEGEPCPTWEQFISEIMEDSVDKVLFLQRFFGYCMSGLTNERYFPVFFGANGQNGKGTLLETLHKIMNGLAGAIPSETLLASNREMSGAAARPDLMALRGKRLCWTSETNKGRALDVAKTKWLSGGDTIVARQNYGQMTSFTPTAKIILLTNHKPKVDAADSAIWHRILLIPFTLTFVEDPKLPHERKRDVNLQEKLLAESSGIMAWLYRGFRQWREIGMCPPDVIKMATKEFRNENDTINRFVEECCLILPVVRVKAGELYDAYKAFCVDAGDNPEASNDFAKQIKERFEHKRNNRGNWYIGITLNFEQEKV
jgi:putative DNA primase/helicase